MKTAWTRSIAFALIASVAWMGTAKPQAEALLVPANLETAKPSATRTADLEAVQKTLESKILREKLHAVGLSDAEIQARLSRLSDDQIHRLATQIRAVHPAGDVGLFGILILAVLVLLIIYLVKRL